MSRKLPSDYLDGERSRYRSVGLVLWSALLCVGVIFGAAVLLQADSPERAPETSDTDAKALSPVESVESERAARKQAVERDDSADGQAEAAVALAESLFPNANVSLDIDRRTGIDFDVSTDAVDVSFSGLGGNETTQSGIISHEAIDSGMERSSSAGLCMVGLDDPSAPVNIDVNGENSSVRAEFNETRGEPETDEWLSPAEIVERCGTYE